jgi:hypothetical protein
MVVTKRDLFVLTTLVAYADVGQDSDGTPALNAIEGWFYQDNVQQLVIPWRDGLYSNEVDDVRGAGIRRDEIERLYAVRDALAEGIKPPPAGNPWPGVVKAYLAGDEHARLALADLYEEAEDLEQAASLREGSVKLFLARWSDDYTFVDQLQEDLEDIDETPRDTRRDVASSCVELREFHTALERDAFVKGVPFRDRYDQAMWGSSHDVVVEEILDMVKDAIGEPGGN